MHFSNINQQTIAYCIYKVPPQKNGSSQKKTQITSQAVHRPRNKTKLRNKNQKNLQQDPLFTDP